MGRSHYQITYIYKGQTLTWKLWAITDFEAREVFDMKMRKEEHNMYRLRVVKVRIIED